MTFKKYDVVVVPFPFTDRKTEKRRPALVLSGNTFNKNISHAVLAMITSQKNPDWPLDVPFAAKKAGLNVPSKIRMKLFTLDCRLIIKKVGKLAGEDRESVEDALDKLFQ